MTDPEADLGRLADEFVARLRAGEPVTAEDYAREHPDLSDRIRELFPVLALMEGAKAPAPDPQGQADIPETIDGYRIVRPVGGGGMGRVFEATDEAGTRVALKVVHPHLVHRRSFVLRFLREFAVGRRIEHRNVVRTLASGSIHVGPTEVPYLVLEFVEGQDLRALLDELGAVPERICRHVGRCIGEGLAAIHAEGIVHRDVKPENVVITAAEVVKLMDLGIALLAEEKARLTATHEFAGSLLYAAPEHLEGGPVDGRSDLYALGLLLHELATGTHPHGRRALADKAPTAHVERPSARNPRLTPFFDAVVLKLLRRDPAERFASAAEVASVLRDGEASAWWRDTGATARLPDRSRRSSATSLHGRTEERNRLTAALDVARSGDARVVLIEGEGGIGKSALVSTWLDQVEGASAPPTVLVAQHDLGTSGLGLSPLGLALQQHLAGPDLEGRLTALLGPSAALAEALARHLGGYGSQEGEGILDAESMPTAYAAVVEGLARKGPVVLVMEDLHLGTEVSRAHFLFLARVLRSAPVLLVGTARPGTPRDFLTALGRIPHAETLALTGLGDDAGAALLRETLGASAPSEDAAIRLVRATDGNPFCLLEWARVLPTEGPVLKGSTLGTVPPSVEELIEARLATLQEEDRHLLATAACCGHLFDPYVVAAAAGIPRLSAFRILTRLEREHDIVRPDGPRYRFQHHLVREVLHAGLPDALRTTLHAALGDATAQAAPADASGALSAEISRHYLLGDQPASALPHLVAGLDHLGSIGEHRRGSELAALAVGRPEISGVALARVHLMLGEAGIEMLPGEDCLRHMDAAAALADELDHTELRVASGLARGVCLRHLGRIDESVSVEEEVLEIARAVGNEEWEARALSDLSVPLATTGEVERARRYAEQGVEIAKRCGFQKIECAASLNLATLDMDVGNLAEAQTLLERSVRLARDLGRRQTESSALIALAKLAYVQGSPTRALEGLERVIELCRDLGGLLMEANARTNVARTLLALGRYEEAVQRAEPLLELTRQQGWADVLAHVHITVGVSRLALGDLERAREHLEASLEAASEARNLLIEMRTRGELAVVLALAGEADAAHDQIEHGLAGAHLAANPEEAGRLRIARASVWEIQGRHEKAREVLGRARRPLENAGAVQPLVHHDILLGRCLARLGRHEEARSALIEGVESAERQQLEPWAALGRIELALLPGGDPLTARLLLEERGAYVPLHMRADLARALHERTGDPRDLAAAEALAERRPLAR